MRFEYNTTLFLIVVGLASTAYTLPFEVSPEPSPNITTRAVSLTPSQPPTDPNTGTGTGTITFLGTHSGVPLLPHESPKISTAYEDGHIPSDVYKRVRKAVREVVPGWGGGGGGVLAFSNSFQGSEGAGGAGARGRVVQYGVIEEWEGGAGFSYRPQLNFFLCTQSSFIYQVSCYCKQLKNEEAGERKRKRKSTNHATKKTSFLRNK
ncbi:hypothetical protein EV359DRAFT_68127 [Lentinula novae-zelandiae]|nr:hypothetical protein EV359DRAFT_68127 [Lentinula novae-zelandiae]